MQEVYFIFILLCVLCYVNSKPNGAPQDSCFYMTPRHYHPHTFRKVWPTQANGLYNITTSADIFRPDRPIRVTLWGPPFKGFMMVAAEEGSKDWPSGIFYSEDGMAKRMTCLGRGDTVTHTNNSYKDSVSILWYGPQNMLSEQVQFVATVVVNKSIYYTNIKSNFIRLDSTLLQGQAGAEGGGVLTATVDPWLSDQTITTAAPWSGTGTGRWDRSGGWGNSRSGGPSGGGRWGTSGGSWGNSGWQSRGQGSSSSWGNPSESSRSGTGWGASGGSSWDQQGQPRWGSTPTSTPVPLDGAGMTADVGAGHAVYEGQGQSGGVGQTGGSAVGSASTGGTGSSPTDVWGVVSSMSPATIARMLRALLSSAPGASTVAPPVK